MPRVNVRIVVPIAAVLMTGCGLHSDDNVANGEAGHSGILAAMRPGADPALVQRLTQEERMRAEAQQRANQQATPQDFSMNSLGRVLPSVSTDPIAPPAEQVPSNSAAVANEEGAVVETVGAKSGQDNAAIASYGASYYAGGVPPPPQGALAGGLVPPPGALPISLTTTAQTYSGAMGETAYNPYANPYFNPYGIPVQPPSAVPQQRPAGLFGNGHSASGSDDGEPARKQATFNPITPSGMKAHSQFQQRDDLRVLWKGAIAQSSYLGGLAGDAKVAAQLNRIQVGMPSESSRGNFNVSGRQIDAIFKSGGIDKHIAPAVRRVETELLQSYYRFLYTYNKYCFAQQTVAARKQEVELADSDAEKQRATADLSQAQNDMEGAKEDMHAAQIELAQASSPCAARAVIGKVAGVTPSLDSLMVAEARSGKGNSGKVAMFGSVFNPLGSFFKLGHAKPETKGGAGQASETDSDLGNQQSETASNDFDTPESAGKAKLKKKDKLANKSKIRVVEADNMPDLTPAPKEEPKQELKSGNEASESYSPSPHLSENTNVSFMLKGVNVSPRKSVLSVAIKNAGADAFNFSPDLISVAEGSRRLSEATARADFDATMVPPNEEVKGTITIFGRPWSDKLTVCLSEHGKAIQMRRP
ncbi:MAG: hypothetical protein C5B53_12725 [Candidatus Melainabacteria bacterium]|nr:MAG: hypothetical protein C5B53_12725 [Candidatus Melainabacteria bacterium]